jgi:hypothetical protein
LLLGLSRAGGGGSACGEKKKFKKKTQAAQVRVFVLAAAKATGAAEKSIKKKNYKTPSSCGEAAGGRVDFPLVCCVQLG